MIQKMTADERYFADNEWLQSYWLFSFGNYYDPENMEFGSLRVFNDDVVAPQKGFPDHPHDTMEIVTIVLDGELTHADSLNNKGVIRAGEVQRMSAGTGVEHSEMNDGNKPVHLYQLWFYPRSETKAGYEQKPVNLKKNALTVLVSNDGREGSLTFNVDAMLYRGVLDLNQKIVHIITENKGVFIYVQKGSMKVQNIQVASGDQLRITKELELTIESLEACDFILIETSM